MKVFVLALCLAVVVVGDHDTTTEADKFCSAVTISLNPVIQSCQTLQEACSVLSDPDVFCASNCSQQLAQALYDCGNQSYTEIISLCAQDPGSSQFCGDVRRNETNVVNLNTFCSGSENCSDDCQTTIDEIGCCVNYFGSEVTLAQCHVQNCTTTIEVSTSQAEALQQCYRSRLHDDSTLAECHGQLESTLSFDEAKTIAFCGGECPTAVANLYSECGLSNFAGAVKNGCERDERGRYCGVLVLSPEFGALVDRAILACNGTDCSSGDCKATIGEIGCCLALDAQVNVTVSTSLPISQCEVKHCPPFSSAPVIYSLPLMIMTIGTLLAVLLL